MTKIEVDNLSIAVNAVVVRLPGRKFVVQGDSLKIMFDLVAEIGRLSGGPGNPELDEEKAQPSRPQIKLLRVRPDISMQRDINPPYDYWPSLAFLDEQIFWAVGPPLRRSEVHF